jgi:TRAP-type mannitol/chloroaromatic compound transport system permease large subunit
MNQIYWAAIPYVLFGLLVLVLILLFPPIATWLPRVLG